MPETTTHLTEIRVAGPTRRARRLVFDDGSERTTSYAVVRALGLQAGAQASLASLGDSLESFERTQARARALRLLSRREHSRAEVTARLKDDGYPSELVDTTVASFESSGLIDDARFAEAWARSRALSGVGRRCIIRELVQKGVDPEVAAGAVEGACEDDEVSRAREQLRGVVPVTRKDRERAVRRLVGRGFELSVALRAVNVDATLEPYQDLD